MISHWKDGNIVSIYEQNLSPNKNVMVNIEVFLWYNNGNTDDLKGTTIPPLFLQNGQAKNDT